jgi:nickel transport protein
VKTRLLLLFAATAAFGHGVEMETIEGGIGLSARYADGAPLAFAEVKVFAPGETDTFQEAQTDREGRFLFRPTTSGVWRVHIDDGMGHGGEFPIKIDHTLSSVSQGPSARASQRLALVAGLGIIWGLFGCYGWYRAARRR